MAKKITMSIDLGGSLTKTIVRSGETEIPFLLPPHVNRLPNRESLPNLVGNARAFNQQIFVGFDDRYYAVGDSARRIDAQLFLRQSKISVAVPKILGLVWLAARTLSLGKKFFLDLRLLLPPSEYGDREVLKKDLMAALSRFETPTGEFSIDLKKFDCFPEGAGIADHYLDRVHSSDNRKCLVIMFGHRNLSFYSLDRGCMGELQTSTLGFSEFLKLIENQCFGYERDKLLEPVAQYLQTGEDKHLKPLLRQSIELHDFEINRLKEAISKARVDFQSKTIGWLSERIPDGIQDVIASGGTFELLGTDFIDYWESHSWNVYSHAGVKLPDYLNDLQVGYRMADVYCLSNLI
jgi:hypothetical protein